MEKKDTRIDEDKHLLKDAPPPVEPEKAPEKPIEEAEPEPAKVDKPEKKAPAKAPKAK
jgi:hypothetical protein